MNIKKLTVGIKTIPHKFSILCFASFFLYSMALFAAERGGENYALLIGNAEYTGDKWPSLTTPVNDILELSAVLIQRYGYNERRIIKLKNPNKKDILRAFYQLAKQATPADSVLVYYAGHGEVDQFGMSWWVPSVSEENYDYLSANEVMLRLKLITAKRKLILSDSCFSGVFFRSSDKRENMASVGSNRKKNTTSALAEASESAQAISSGGNGPVSDGGLEWGGHSIFAYHLLAQLKANQERRLSASALFKAIEGYVTNDTAMIGKPQTPFFFELSKRSSESEEFVFISDDQGESDGPQSVAIVFRETVNPDFEAYGKNGRLLLQNELVEILERNGFQSSPYLNYMGLDDDERDLVAILRGLKYDAILLIILNIDLSQQQTRIWSAIANASAEVWIYLRSNDELIMGQTYRTEPQKLPIVDWDESNLYKKDQFEAVLRKLSRSFRKTEFASYLRQQLN